MAGGVRRNTDPAGDARLPWGANATLRVRVRQVGFVFADTVLRRDPARAPDEAPVRVALARLAYRLTPVVTTATNACAPPADSGAEQLTASLLDQLRLGAERYVAFRDAYPFTVWLERRSANLVHDRRPIRVGVAHEKGRGETWGDPYDPGRVLDHERFGFSVAILFVSTLADERFWAHHCFAVAGVRLANGVPVVQLDFTPTPATRAPDWAGSAYLDSATKMLRRVDFRLAGLRDDDSPRRFEGHTTFCEPSPFVAVPDSSIAIWWRDGPGDGGRWGDPDAVQSLSVDSLTYRRSPPPVPVAAPSRCAAPGAR